MDRQHIWAPAIGVAKAAATIERERQEGERR